MTTTAIKHKFETVEINSLAPHPSNYRKHNPDQLKHIAKSIETHGLYRNVVVARDGTILAGHGVVQACRALGITEIPVARLDIASDDVRAMKLLTGDNEISRLGEIDDRLLSEILRDISLTDDLLGTGFDELQLANLVFVTRPESEIKDFNAAREWAGLPAYQESEEDPDGNPLLVIEFKNIDDRNKFVTEKKIKIGSTKGGRKWSTTWPYVERNDTSSVRFESAAK